MNSKKFVLAMVSKVTIVLLEIGFFAIVLFQYYGPTIFSNMESVGFIVTPVYHRLYRARKPVPRL